MSSLMVYEILSANQPYNDAYVQTGTGAGDTSNIISNTTGRATGNITSNITGYITTKSLKLTLLQLGHLSVRWEKIGAKP